MPEGEGNLDQDPRFMDAAQRDYHLRSEQGRWDPATEAWVSDAETSPCIDRGDPADDYAAERCPNGGRIDLARTETRWRPPSR